MGEQVPRALFQPGKPVNSRLSRLGSPVFHYTTGVYMEKSEMLFYFTAVRFPDRIVILAVFWNDLTVKVDVLSLADWEEKRGLYGF